VLLVLCCGACNCTHAFLGCKRARARVCVPMRYSQGDHGWQLGKSPSVCFLSSLYLSVPLSLPLADSVSVSVSVCLCRRKGRMGVRNTATIYSISAINVVP
jgi:hypothetical protein